MDICPHRDTFALCLLFSVARLQVGQLKQCPFDLKCGPCLSFPRHAQFHPLRYLAGLARAIKLLDGRLFGGTEAKEIKGGKTAKIGTNRHAIVSAGAVVVATNTPINDRAKVYTKQEPYRIYVIGALVPTGSTPKALYWDTEDQGEDHKTGQAEGIEGRSILYTAVRTATQPSQVLRLAPRQIVE